MRESTFASGSSSIRSALTINHAPTRIEDMTNGNSAERERFEAWLLEYDKNPDGPMRVGVMSAWIAWQARAALSVCADGGKDSSVAQDCPHAGVFRYCAECVVSPCPIGLGEKT